MADGLLIQEGVRLFFLNDAALVALIGQRFHDAEIPQNAVYPCCTLQLVSSVPDYTHRGESGQEFARFTVAAHADCGNRCMQIAAQLRRIIRDQPRGVFPGSFHYSALQRMNETAIGRAPGRNIAMHAIDFRLIYTDPA